MKRFKSTVTSFLLPFLLALAFILLLNLWVYPNSTPPLLAQTPDLNAGLVAYYQFNGNADDSSGNGHHGTATTGVSYAPGIEGQAVYFDGTTEQRVTIQDHDDFDNDYTFSISAWVKPTQYRIDASYPHFIVSQWWTHPSMGDYTFALTSGTDSGKFRVHIANTTSGYTDDWLFGPSNAIVPLNKWSHIAITFNNGILNVYLDGQLIATKVSTVTHTELTEYSTDNIIIGNAWTNQWYEYGFIGNIDEVRLYNRALSEAEISQLATNTNQVAIYALAFDIPLTSPTRLDHLYQPTMQEIITATYSNPAVTAIVLADMPGHDNTLMYEIKNGTSTLLNGLPDASGVLSSTLREYNMANGVQLGGFISYTLQTYPHDKASFSYIGHDGPLVPETAITNIIPSANPPYQYPKVSANFYPPLPTHVDAQPSLTDFSPGDALLSVYDLRLALQIGTNNGQHRLDVLDTVHCFGATLEEFSELAPYAKTMTGSPNYTYFAPKMAGAVIKAVNPMMTATRLASETIKVYDTVLAEYDVAVGEVVHPRLYVAVESDKLADIKLMWDNTAYQLLNHSDKPYVMSALKTAYLQSNKYDSYYCDKDYSLAPPDELSDMYDFVNELKGQFENEIYDVMVSTQSRIKAAIIISYTASGEPWFAPDPKPFWDFNNNQGIALYTPLISKTVGNTAYLSYQIRWYTPTVSLENPHPYHFVQPQAPGPNVTWADMLYSYWSGENVQTMACFPNLPAPKSDGEMEVTAVIYPQKGYVTADSPIIPSAQISTTALSGVPLVQFLIEHAGAVVYSNTVPLGMGTITTGTYRVDASQAWYPTLPSYELYTVTVTVDPDNRIAENDETNNSFSMSGDVVRWYDCKRPILNGGLLNNVQWVTDREIVLNLNYNSSTAIIDELIVETYQYQTSGKPNTQVPVRIAKSSIKGFTDLNNISYTLPTNTQAGIVHLAIWGLGTCNTAHPPLEIQFNYNPPNTPIAETEEHYFLFNALNGDNVALMLTVPDNNDANLFVWGPYDVGSPSGQGTNTGNDQVLLNNIYTGKYLVSIRGETSLTTTYTLSTTRNNILWAKQKEIRLLLSQPNPTAYVPKTRPIFIAPIFTPPSSLTNKHIYLPFVIKQ